MEPQNNANYRIYRLKPKKYHKLYTVPLEGLRGPPGTSPEFFQRHEQQLATIINENSNMSFHRELSQIYREFEAVRTRLSLQNYVKRQTINLCLWAQDLRRQMMLLKVPTCYISAGERDEEGNFFVFHIEGCDEVVSIGDFLVATCHAEMKKYFGRVSRISGREIEAQMPREFQLSKKKTYEVHCDLRWIPFVIQENCLRKVHSTFGRKILFPLQVSRRESLAGSALDTLEWHNPLMNHFQRQAVRNVLAAEHRPVPYLVNGPPGTGKTSTLIEYVHQVWKLANSDTKNKILIVTPSNTAANVILAMLCQSRWIDVRGEVIRMVSASHLQSGLLPGNLRRFCGVLPMKNPPNSLTVIDTLAKLKNYRIVVTTINFCGNFWRMGLTKHFTHLIVDEAGQAVETETLVPIALMDESSHIVLFGDEKQLGPVITYEVLLKLGFGISLLERLSALKIYEENPPLLSRLLNNYRSVPHLLKFYNELFYQERLVAMVTETTSPEFRLLEQLEDLFPHSNNRQRHRGLFFFRCSGECSKDVFSWHNPGEAQKLVDFYENLLRTMRSGDIGIVTPYRAQVREITETIQRRKLAMPKVGSVEIFQGDQRMVMLFSPVRSFVLGSRSVQNISLGFVNNPKRINVAISRARALLVIFGNDQVLKASEHWSKLIRIADADSTLIR